MKLLIPTKFMIVPTPLHLQQHSPCTKYYSDISCEVLKVFWPGTQSCWVSCPMPNGENEFGRMIFIQGYLNTQKSLPLSPTSAVLVYILASGGFSGYLGTSYSPTRVGKEYKNLWQTLADVIFPCLNFPSSFLMGSTHFEY